MNEGGLLTTTQAAARLGVKPQTLYAYVSRGLLHRTVAMDGRSSLFDPGELDALRLGRTDRREGELRAVISTAVTHVDDAGLLVRGVPLIDIVADGVGFIDVADFVWQTPERSEPWPAPRTDVATVLEGLDGLRSLVAQSSADDALRHDLAPASVRHAGRRMLVAMTHGLTPRRAGRDRVNVDVVSALWRRLTKRKPSPDELRALEVALVLLVDHGMAASTFAARIAASVRSDPYSVVTAGLGALGGPLHGAASAGVHRVIADAERAGDAAVAIGELLRDGEQLPGFGHSVYTVQDPRYTALMSVIVQAWRDDDRLGQVFRVRDVVAERRADFPNIDAALGALTWLAEMDPTAGESIFAVARTVGWLAHAAEEYAEAPLRFRPRARYTGPRLDGPDQVGTIGD